MNRPIKFRCWDRSEKKWLTVEEMPLYPSGAEDKETVFSLTPSWDNLIFCQFTGLLDREGREIYEGDILKSALMTVLMPVKWYDESAGFNLAWIRGHNVTVIGNLWEHQDLLK